MTAQQTPAEERAAVEGLPVVLLMPFECMRIAAGNPMIVALADGTEALARLFTAEEFLALQHAAADKWEAPRIDMAKAVELTKPLAVQP